MRKTRESRKGILWWIAVLIALAIASAYWIAMLRWTIVPYKSFDEVRRCGGVAQVYGEVVSDYRTNDAGCIEFKMKDAVGVIELVRYCGVPPIGLEKGRHIVAVGKFDGKVFVATQLLTKCPSRYSVGDGRSR